MYRPISYALLFIAAMASTSCKKSNSSSESGPLTGLVGSWNWVLTVNNGISSGNVTGNPFGDSLTPANTGIHQTLTFNANGTWELTQNSNPFSQGVFKIDSLPTPGGFIGFLDLVPSDGTDSILNHTIVKDTLILSNPHVVGWDRNWIYVRT